MRYQPQQYNDWTKKSYLKRVLIAIDQLFNALFGGNPDMSMSGRIGYRIYKGKATWIETKICRFLSWLFVDPKHCLTSVELDEFER